MWVATCPVYRLIILFHRGQKNSLWFSSKRGSIFNCLFVHGIFCPQGLKDRLDRQTNWPEDVHGDPSKPSSWHPIPSLFVWRTSSVANHRQLMVVTDWSDPEALSLHEQEKKKTYLLPCVYHFRFIHTINSLNLQ